MKIIPKTDMTIDGRPAPAGTAIETSEVIATALIKQGLATASGKATPVAK